MENPTPTRGAPGGRRHIHGLVIALLVSAVALAAPYTGVEYFASSNSALAGPCGTLSIQRRGLPCDVPLPAGARFETSKVLRTTEAGVETDWTYMIPHGWETVRAVYHTELHAQGWKCVRETDFEGIFISGFGKSDRAGQSVEIIFLMGNDSQTEIEIALFQRDPFAGLISCS